METIPLNSVCLEYRDDILFHCFIYENNYLKQWREFVLSCPIKKASKGVEKFVSRYPELTGRYTGHNYVKFTRVVESIKNVGQMEPIPIHIHNNKMYPCDGAKRIAAMVLLRINQVKVITCLGGTKWRRDYSINSPYFQNAVKSLIDEFLVYQKNLREELHGTNDT